MANINLTSSPTELATSAFNTSVNNYASFSGAQLRCYINNVQISQLMAVSYAIHTEKAAQYTLGSANPRNFATGKRGIAGTLVFNTFDRAPLLSIFAGSNNFGESLVQAYTQNNIAGFQSQFINFNTPSDISGQAIPNSNALSYYQNEYGGVGNYQGLLQGDIAAAQSQTLNAPLTYYDQLPPFDITLTFVNTQGNGAFMVIAGVECINEGGGFNIDDLTNQTAFSYVAREIYPLTPIDNQGNVNSSQTIPVGTIASSAT